MSFEIMEERQHMVLEYLREREVIDNQSRSRADQIMKQFTDTLSGLDETFGLNIGTQKTINSTVTQTKIITTKDTEMQTSLRESKSFKKVEKSSETSCTSKLFKVTEMTQSKFSESSDETIDENINDMKTDVSIVMSSEKNKSAPKQDSKSLIALKSLCKNIDDLEVNMEFTLNEIKSLTQLRGNDIESLMENISKKSEKQTKQKIEQILQKLVKDKNLESLNKNHIGKLFANAKSIRNDMKIKERSLKQLLKSNFSNSSNDQTTNENESNTIEQQTIIKNTTFAEIKDSSSFEPKLPSKEVSLEATLNLASNELETETKTRSLLESTEAMNSFIKSDKSLKDKVNKELQELLAAQRNHSDIVAMLKEEEMKAVSELRNIVSNSITLAKRLKELKTEKHKLKKVQDEHNGKKKYLENQVKSLNKTIAEKLICKEREDDIKNAERKITEIDKQIKKIEMQIANKDDNIVVTEQNISEKEDMEEELYKHLATLQKHFAKLLPYIKRGTPKYRDIEVADIQMPSENEIDDLIKQRNEFSQKLLMTENEIQEIITSTGYESDDNVTLTSISEHKNSNNGAENENKKVDLNYESLQLEIQLEDLTEKTKYLKNENDILNEVAALKKSLFTVQKQIKAASQIPRPIEDNKQLKGLKEEIEQIKRKLQAKNISDSNFDQQNLNRLKQQRNRTEQKIEQIKKRIENEKVNGNDIGNILKNILHERNRVQSTIISLQNDIDSLNEIKQNTKDNEDIVQILTSTEKNLLREKSKHLFNLARSSGKELCNLFKVIQGYLRLKLDRFEDPQFHLVNDEQKTQLYHDYSDIVRELNQIQIDIDKIEQKQSENPINSSISQDLVLLMNKKKENEKLYDEISNAEVETLSFENDNEITKALIKKKMEIKDTLNSVAESVQSKYFILKEKKKKIMKVKTEVENEIINTLTKHDIIELINEINSVDRKTKGNLKSLFDERYSLEKNIEQALNQLHPDRDKINNLVNVLDSVDAVILNHLQNFRSKLSIQDTVSGKCAMLFGNIELKTSLLDSKLELDTLFQVDNGKLNKEEQFVEEREMKRQLHKIQNLEKLKKKLKQFCNRKINLEDIDKLTELKNLNQEKANILLAKLKTLNTLLSTQRKVSNNKKRGNSQNSTQDIKILKLTTEKINKELENIIEEYQSDIKSNDKIMERKIFIESPSPDKKDTLGLILRGRDESLRHLFHLEKQIELTDMNCGDHKKLLEQKQLVENQINLFDEKIIEGEFSMTVNEVTDQMTATRSFSPKSTSSRNSLTSALDERDQVLKQLFELQRSEENIKTSDSFLNKNTELKEISQKKNDLSSRLKQIDDKITEVAAIDDDISLNSEYTSLPNYLVTNKTISNEIESLTDELKTGKLKLYRSDGDCEKNIDIEELITDKNEKDILKNLEYLNNEIRKEKLKLQLSALEIERKKLEDNLKGRKSPDRMLLKKEEQDILNAISDKERELQTLSQKDAIEQKLKLIKDALIIPQELEENLNNTQHFIKTEKGITVREYKKNKIRFETKLDGICLKMAQYAKFIEQKVKDTDDQIKNKDQKANNTLNREVTMAPYLDGGLDALKSHRTGLKQLIIKLTNMNSESKQEISMDELITKRTVTLTQISDINDKIRKTDYNKLEDNIKSEMSSYIEKSKRNSLGEKRLEIKIRLIKERLETMRETIDIQNNEQMKDIVNILGEELHSYVIKQQQAPEEFHYFTSKLQGKTVTDYLNEVTTSLENTTAKYTSVKRENEEIKFKMDELNEQIKKGENIVNEKEKKILELTENIQDITNNFEDGKTEIFKKENNDKLYQEAIQYLHDQNEVLNKEKELMEETMRSLETEISELKKKLTLLPKEINEIRLDEIDQKKDIGLFAVKQLTFKDCVYMLKEEPHHNDIALENEKLKVQLSKSNDQVTEYLEIIRDKEQKELLLQNSIDEREKSYVKLEIMKKEMENQIIDLRAEKNTLTLETGYLRGELETLKESSDAIKQKHEAIDSKNLDLLARIDKLEKIYNDVCLENCSLTEKIGNLEHNEICLSNEIMLYHADRGKNKVKLEELEYTTESLHKENIALKIKLKESEDLNEDLNETVKKLTQEKDDNSSLHENNDLISEKCTSLMKKIENKESTLNTFNAKIQCLQDEKDHLIAKLRDSEVKHESVINENNDFRKTFADLTEITKKFKKRSKKQNKVNNFEQTEGANYHIPLEDGTRNCKKTEKDLLIDLIIEIVNSHNNVSETNRILNTKLQSNEEATKELKDKVITLEKQRDVHLISYSKIKNVQDNMKSENAHLNEKIREFENILQQIQQENINLRKERDNLFSNMDELKNSNYDLTGKNKQSVETKHILEEFQGRQDMIENDKLSEIAMLNQEIDSLKQKMASFYENEKNLREMNRKLDDDKQYDRLMIKALQDQINDLNDKNENTLKSTQTITELQNKLKREEMNSQQLQQRIKELQKFKSCPEEDSTKFLTRDQEIELLRQNEQKDLNENEKLLKEIKQLKLKVHHFDLIKGSLKEREEDLILQKSNLQSEINKLKEENFRLCEQLSFISDEVVHRETHGCDKVIEDLNNSVDIKEQQIPLKEEFLHNKEEKKMLSQEYTELIKNLKKNCKELLEISEISDNGTIYEEDDLLVTLQKLILELKCQINRPNTTVKNQKEIQAYETGKINQLLNEEWDGLNHFNTIINLRDSIQVTNNEKNSFEEAFISSKSVKLSNEPPSAVINLEKIFCESHFSSLDDSNEDIFEIETEPLHADEVSLFKEEALVFYDQPFVCEEKVVTSHVFARGVDILDGTFENEERMLELREENTKVKKELERVNSEIMSLRHANDILAFQNKDSEKKLKEIKKFSKLLKNSEEISSERNQLLEAEVNSCTQVICSLNEKILELNQKITTLEDEVLEVQGNYDREKLIQTQLKEEKEKLELDLFSRDNVITNLSIKESGQEREIIKLQNELYKSTEQINMLDQEKLHVEHGAQNEKFNNSVNKLTEEFDCKSTNIGKLRIDLDRLMADNLFINQAKEKLQEEHNEALQIIDRMQQENKEHELKISEFEKKEEILKNKILDLEKERFLLQVKVNQECNEKNMTLKELHENMKYALTTKTKIIENKDENYAKLQEKNLRLKEDIKTLNYRLQDLEELKTQNSRMKREIENLCRINNKEMNRDEVVVGHLTKLNSQDSMFQFDLYKSQLNKIKAKVGDTLFDILTNIDALVLSTTMQCLKEQLGGKSVEEIYEDIAAENAEVKCALENANTQLQNAMNRKQGLENELLEANKKFKEKQIQLDNEVTKQKQSDHTNQNEKLILDEQISAQNSIIEDMNIHNEKVMKENKRLLSELNEHICKLVDMEQKYILLKEKSQANENYLEEKQQELKSLQSVALKSEGEAEKMRKDIEKLNSTIGTLKKENHLQKETIASAIQEKNELEDKVEITQRKVKKIQLEKDGIKESFDNEIKSNEYTEEKMRNLEQLIKEKESLVAEISEQSENQILQVNELKSDKLRLESELQNLKKEVAEARTLYDNLKRKSGQEASLLSQEIKVLREHLEKQNIEIVNLNEKFEIKIKEQVETIKVIHQNEKYSDLNLINELRLKIEQTQMKNYHCHGELAEFRNKLSMLEVEKKDLVRENQTLCHKIKEVNIKYDKDLVEVKNQLNETNKKLVDSLNYKIRRLTNELMELEKLKDNVENELRDLKMRFGALLAEKENMVKSVQEKTLSLEEKERFAKIKSTTLQFEIDGLKLENNELNEQVKDLKYDINKNQIYKNYEKEIYEQKRQLEMAMKKFEEEKTNFEANIEEIMIRTNEKYLKSETEKEETYTLKLLKTSHEEREKLSNELINVNKELINTKNELRKLKQTQKQKEEKLELEEKELIMNIENEYKHKLDDIVKCHKKEIERLVKISNEERYKYEEEMKNIKVTLQEENTKQLVEQRLDFERELKQHVCQYLKDNEEELEELNTKYEAIKSEKLEMIKQFENERSSMKKKYDSERYSLIETIRRLLKNVMRFKQQRIK